MMVATRRSLVAIVLGYASLKVAPVTLIAYWPVDTRIDGFDVTHYRLFPGDTLGLPRPNISYVETVAPMTLGHNGGHVCQDEGGPFPYDKSGSHGSWNIPWAAACLSDPRGYVWQAHWTWHLGGFELGPTSAEKIVLKGNDDK